MSLDISLSAVVRTDVFSDNITGNVEPMWREAGCHDALYKSKGKAAYEVLDELKAGLSLMESEPERFKALNPSNGWGDYDGALEWLRRLICVFELYPDGKIWSSK